MSNVIEFTRATERKRPPVSERRDRDLQGAELGRYVERLHERLITHMEKMAPRWHRRDTLDILRRWEKPQLGHPKPNWAPPIDRVTEAATYAAQRIQMRMAMRDARMQSIRLRMGYPESGPIGPTLGPSNGGGPTRSGPKR